MFFYWRVLTIGHLSRNKFWGESNEQAYREPLATASLIQGDGVNILVDPSLEAVQMQQVLFERCGLTAADIGIIYCTHFHGDHCQGLVGFPNARCYMAPQDLRAAKVNGALEPDVLDRFREAPEELIPGVRRVSLPGHTEGICGLAFQGPEGRIVVSGDAVMSHEFFQAEEGYWYDQNLAASTATIRWLKREADLVVPGHGNYFMVCAYR